MVKTRAQQERESARREVDADASAAAAVEKLKADEHVEAKREDRAADDAGPTPAAAAPRVDEPEDDDIGISDNVILETVPFAVAQRGVVALRENRLPSTGERDAIHAVGEVVARCLQSNGRVYNDMTRMGLSVLADAYQYGDQQLQIGCQQVLAIAASSANQEMQRHFSGWYDQISGEQQQRICAVANDFAAMVQDNSERAVQHVNQVVSDLRQHSDALESSVQRNMEAFRSLFQARFHSANAFFDSRMQQERMENQARAEAAAANAASSVLNLSNESIQIIAGQLGALHKASTELQHHVRALEIVSQIDNPEIGAAMTTAREALRLIHEAKTGPLAQCDASQQIIRELTKRVAKLEQLLETVTSIMVRLGRLDERVASIDERLVAIEANVLELRTAARAVPQSDTHLQAIVETAIAANRAREPLAPALPAPGLTKEVLESALRDQQELLTKRFDERAQRLRADFDERLNAMRRDDNSGRFVNLADQPQSRFPAEDRDAAQADAQLPTRQAGRGPRDDVPDDYDDDPRHTGMDAFFDGLRNAFGNQDVDAATAPGDSDSCNTSLMRAFKLDRQAEEQDHFKCTLIWIDLGLNEFMVMWTSYLNSMLSNRYDVNQEYLGRLALSFHTTKSAIDACYVAKRPDRARTALVLLPGMNATHAYALVKLHRILLQDIAKLILRASSAAGYMIDAVPSVYKELKEAERSKGKHGKRIKMEDLLTKARATKAPVGSGSTNKNPRQGRGGGRRGGRGAGAPTSPDASSTTAPTAAHGRGRS